MQRLWTPWRMEYLAQDRVEGCVFCQKLREDVDRENLILYRARSTCVIMNLYPYNTGHLMTIPYDHISNLEDLPEETYMELMYLTRESLKVLRRVLRPDGFNVGANIGKSAGAGIEKHVHVHIVPRWDGDTNFMPVFAETRVMPEMLLSTYDKLAKEFEQMGME